MEPIGFGAHTDGGDLLAVARPLPAAHPPRAQTAFAMQAVDVDRTALFDLGAA
jgi:hypothetical protein